MIRLSPRPVNNYFLCEQPVSDEPAALALKNVFFFLGLIFRYPDEIVYDEIQRHLDAFGDFFAQYADRVPALPDIADLQAEYVSLFVNNKGFVPAIPYASFHMDQNRLMGRTYFRIKQIMLASGLCLDTSESELEDHLSVMLESCAELMQVCIAKECDPQKIQPTFSALVELTANIKNWVDDFAGKVFSCASMDFYKVSAEALQNLFHDIDGIFEQALGMGQKNKPIAGVNR
jgi:TorA maturation chaperone TorD